MPYNLLVTDKHLHAGTATHWDNLNIAHIFKRKECTIFTRESKGFRLQCGQRFKKFTMFSKLYNPPNYMFLKRVWGWFAATSNHSGAGFAQDSLIPMRITSCITYTKCVVTCSYRIKTKWGAAVLVLSSSSWRVVLRAQRMNERHECCM